ncbi:hypothetical protein [Dactylosporangium sp. NPDC051484]|uniref:SMODS domain-containing nucleotidyltransferase n=1 Tax=Dactylosporangium sp. NPDC051484 TaxID=3154942 RepID=UPI00344FDCC9
MVDATLYGFAETLAPAAPDRTEVSLRRQKILQALSRSNLRVDSMFESGSWSHGTGVRAHSDVDYMARATGNRPMRPSTALAVAKEAIRGCDFKITSTAVSSPVIAVGYSSVPNFEIAPAWYYGTSNGFDVYVIAGRKDEWVFSAPEAHLKYVDRQNDRLSKKVKPLARLLKAWKYHMGVPVSSFYLEMRTAEFAAGVKSIVYDVDLPSMLGRLIGFGVRDMNDPEQIVGRIPACASDEKERRTIQLAKDALAHLAKAAAAKERRDAGEYWNSMYQIFGAGYPWPSW